ncbi:MAG: acyltransferase family protein, partial [Ilumatobacteraceae bacterium]
MNKRSDLLTYIPSLDGIRALSVLAVIVYHANKIWLPGGFLGVEVFFVISGYLITLLLLAESEKNGTVSLKDFWLRRARRLLPALWIVVLGVVVFAALFQREILGTLRGDVVAALFYGFNWFQVWVGTSYFTSFEFVPLRHLWS